MRTILLFLAAGALTVFGVVMLSGCENPLAAHELARADRIRAETEAVQVRAEAAAERAAIREAQRDASHERALEILPYMLLIVGVLVLAGFAAFAVWDLRRAAMSGMVHLERLRLEQAERDRALWLAMSRLDRIVLPEGQRSREVVVYPERKR